MGAIFTIDLEDWNDALHIPSRGHSSIKEFHRLISLLETHNIRPGIYALDYLRPLCVGHYAGTHGTYHRWWENADRRPYQWLGLTGGFWFRLLPLWFIKGQVRKHGMFYIHPHDLDENHPRLKNPFLNWKRHVGLKSAWKKLERLLLEVKFDSPR